jgi:hypothetical protein
VPYFLWGNRRPGPIRVFIPAADRSAPSGPHLIEVHVAETNTPGDRVDGAARRRDHRVGRAPRGSRRGSQHSRGQRQRQPAPGHPRRLRCPLRPVRGRYARAAVRRSAAPEHFVQMAPGGKQLPNGETVPAGDALVVAPEAAAGGRQGRGADARLVPELPLRLGQLGNWLSAVDTQVKAVLASGDSNISAIELWNEPDWTWDTSAAGPFDAGWAEHLQRSPRRRPERSRSRARATPPSTRAG